MMTMIAIIVIVAIIVIIIITTVIFFPIIIKVESNHGLLIKFFMECVASP